MVTKIKAAKSKPMPKKVTAKVTPESARDMAAIPTERNAKPKLGRPSKYTPAIVDEICERLGNGEPLREICRSDHMPHWNTVYDWMDADKALSGRIARAREKGEEAIAQQCLEIADELPQRTGFGNIDSGDIQHKKLRIETRLKLLAKWNPKKWAEKVDLNHGVQPENPLASLMQRLAGTGLPVVKDAPDDSAD